MESSTSSYSFFLFRLFQVLLHQSFGFKSLSLMKEQLAGLPLPASPASKCSVRLESTVWDPGTAGRVRRSFFTHQCRAADAKPQANNSPTGNQKIDGAAQVFNYCLKLEVTGGKKARVQPSSCCWVQVSPGVTCILVMLERNRLPHLDFSIQLTTGSLHDHLANLAMGVLLQPGWELEHLEMALVPQVVIDLWFHHLASAEISSRWCAVWCSDQLHWCHRWLCCSPNHAGFEHGTEIRLVNR